ncbi:hypothetical protein Y032_0557g3406 [Ancylostoma ceylanicum]|uniref:Uncharacterized protein n=1 Tax=Ancylostoma ceylanicum TaxID=53326 RepID=A0A016WRX8_9BILA|nr:hypothetical protein Y032_0557g3406 [Ancylostoma ceylanicum]
MSTVFVISTPNHLCVQDKTQRTHIATDGYKNTARMSSPDAYALPEPALSEPDGRGQTDLPARTAPALHPTLLFSQTFVGVECRDDELIGSDKQRETRRKTGNEGNIFHVSKDLLAAGYSKSDSPQK